jgi:cytidine deaminase
MTDAELIEKARSLARPRTLAGSTSGQVGCALVAADGQVYTGVCIDMPCGMGFCAEHAAAAAMVTQGQRRILKIVAVCDNGEVIPPCGRCREFMRQLDEKNMDTEVLLAQGKTVSLRELLPHPW